MPVGVPSRFIAEGLATPVADHEHGEFGRQIDAFLQDGSRGPEAFPHGGGVFASIYGELTFSIVSELGRFEDAVFPG
jgi:hypothetical protein